MLSTSLNHIQVCCRIRAADDGQPPTISSYLNTDANETNRARSYEVMTTNGSFQMDYAFDSTDSQECIFDRIVQPLLTDAFAGFNCSLFSYGQTGSGKTYTLVGNASAGANLTSDDKERGIIPRAAETIFTKQANLDPQKVMCQVRLSILEVYQEQLKDLLRVVPPASAVPAPRDAVALRIREQMDGTVWVENLTELVVAQNEEFNRLLSSALKRRVVGAHNMNDVSSRSHFCCILNIHQVFHATGVKINSKVHFIDLAGSEMVRKTDATGVRFTEAKHINKSLSALGNVIYALSGGSKLTADAQTGAEGSIANGATNLTKSQSLQRVTSNASLVSNITSGGGGGAASVIGGGKDVSKTHVPYRDSKLTRLLQNSLGGNAKTVIILTISDAKRHLSETLSTLRFGARARQIQTRAVVNKSILEDQALMKKNYTKALQENSKLQDLVAELQAELHQLRQHGSHFPPRGGGGGNDGLGGEEAVCEICRNFLDMKLRSEAPSTASQAKNVPPRRPSIREDLQGMFPQPSPPPVLIPAGFSAGTDSPDEYSLVEPAERCAICGLSGDESDKLQQYTGEVLGEMFSCDGNCGHQFHVRCVGLVGDGGQYTLPDGEWFCTECYSAYDAQDSILRAPSVDMTSVAGSNSSVGGGEGRGIALGGSHQGGGNVGKGSGDEEGDEEGTEEESSSDALYQSLSSSDMQVAAVETLKIAPNKNPSSVLATIKAEYHTMRKERNRILAQWQQEKRIIEKYEISRRIEQQKRDQELINAKDTIQQLESIVSQGEAQSARMQKLFDIMLKELQLSTSNMTTMNSTSNATNSAAIRNSVDRLKWASLTVESLLDMPVDLEKEPGQSSPSHYAAQPSPRAQAAGGSFTRSPKGLQHSATSPNFRNSHASSMMSPSSGSGSSSSAGAGIPKPWKGKVRTGASGAVAESSGASPSPMTPRSSAMAAAGQAALRSSRSGAGAGDNVSPRAPTASVPDNAATTTGMTRNNNIGGNGARATISPKGGTGSSSGAGATGNSATASSSRAAPRRTEAAAAERVPKRDESSPDESESKRRGSDVSDSGSESSRGKSKFINPLKNRLKDLLKSVEAETDAFAEIRQKFKSREEERNQLRNSQTLER